MQYDAAMKPSRQHWDPVVRTLHWLMAAMLAGQWALGKIAVGYRLSPTKLDLFVWHKSIGILLLVLVLLRIVWRLLHRRPALPADMNGSVRTLAHASHLLLYTLMLTLPISGWIIQSGANIPFRIFWLIPLPNLPGVDKALRETASFIHEWAGWLLLLMVILHVSAALLHHFHHRNHVLKRMLKG